MLITPRLHLSLFILALRLQMIVSVPCLYTTGGWSTGIQERGIQAGIHGNHYC